MDGPDDRLGVAPLVPDFLLGDDAPHVQRDRLVLARHERLLKQSEVHQGHPLTVRHDAPHVQPDRLVLARHERLLKQSEVHQGHPLTVRHDAPHVQRDRLVLARHERLLKHNQAHQGRGAVTRSLQDTERCSGPHGAPDHSMLKLRVCTCTIYTS